MKNRLIIGILALWLPFNRAFPEQIAVEISSDQPAALTTLNGEEKQIRLPAIFFLEKNREYQFDIKGAKGFSFAGDGLTFSRSEKLKIRLGYEPYVIGKEYCYWALLLPGICGITTGEHVLGGSLIFHLLEHAFSSGLAVSAASASASSSAAAAGASWASWASWTSWASCHIARNGVGPVISLLGSVCNHYDIFSL